MLMMRGMIAPLLLAAAVATDSVTMSTDNVVTLTPCADNSYRVQIAPKHLPQAAASTLATLKQTISDEGLTGLPGAFLPSCDPIPSRSHTVQPGGQQTNGNLRVAVGADGSLTFTRVEDNKILTTATPSLLAPSSPVTGGYLNATLRMAAGDQHEKIYGLGQGGWTAPGGCPSGNQTVVPLVRNGQTVNLCVELYIEPTTTLRDTLFAPPLMLTCRVCWSRACAVCKRSFTSQSRRLCRAQGMALYSTCQATDR